MPEPVDAWEERYDESGVLYYFHALTGATSWMSEEEAATRLQRAFRRSRAKDYTLGLFAMAKGVRFIQNGELG